MQKLTEKFTEILRAVLGDFADIILEDPLVKKLLNFDIFDSLDRVC